MIKKNEVVILILVIFIIYLGFKAFSKKDTYQGIYYPNGCLTCSNYIVSPDLNSPEDCIKWGEELKSQSGNQNDLWECGKNCRWESGFSICEETFGEEGTGIHY